jgi:hypothetical protein
MLDGTVRWGRTQKGHASMADTDIVPAAQDPDSLVSEIERTRDNLARTIDAIADRVSPANNARRVMDQVREQTTKIDMRVVAAGAAVVVGAAVLMFVRRRRNRR